MAEKSELLQGTLDLLLLKVLSLEPMHGWGITLRMEQMSGSVLLLNQGSLYPALERLRDKGWIRSDWQLTENNRRARYYSLTAAGRRQLAAERAAWKRVSTAVNAIVDWAGALP
ncbi:MAG: PadR family transcriptional regulator [Gemmatimonadetes bacterium]|nr:PadR family transcriptional regulator [Gemmatimonadota bacterium]